MSMYTPAVTRVDECTSEDTGVGAAMAAGSHAEKGIWALLVMAPTTRIAPTNMNVLYLLKFIAQWPLQKDQQIARIISESPIRFLRAVIIPAARDLSF